jgi:site-specific DNA-methyltransferase (adenine-specific)
MEIINQIVCGNCIDVMQEMPSECIDLTITSPPYGNTRSYKGMVSEFKFKSIADLLYKITKPGGVVVWVVNDETINGSETGMSFEQALYFKAIGFNIHDTMIYEKNACRFPESNRYYPVFEYMFVFSKGKPKTYNLIQDRANKCCGEKIARKNSIRTKHGSFVENSAYKLERERKIKPVGIRFNVWSYNIGSNNTTKDKIALKHPAVFPEQLAEDHIISWSNPGDIVFDPMMGSGTVLKMARKNQRNYFGIDVVPEYVEITKQRLGIV